MYILHYQLLLSYFFNPFKISMFVSSTYLLVFWVGHKEELMFNLEFLTLFIFLLSNLEPLLVIKTLGNPNQQIIFFLKNKITLFVVI